MRSFCRAHRVRPLETTFIGNHSPAGTGPKIQHFTTTHLLTLNAAHSSGVVRATLIPMASAGARSEPELTDPVTLVGDQDFTASVALDDWLLIGGAVEVRKGERLGPWKGEILSFKRSRYSIAEWFLASGDRREHHFFSEHDQDFAVGHVFPVTMGANTWDATVIAAEPATTVVVRFTIQNGAHRRRDFFRRGQLLAYAKPNDDGTVSLMALNP